MKLKVEIEADHGQQVFIQSLYQLDGECAFCDKRLPPKPRYVIAFPEIVDGKLYLMGYAIDQSCNDRIRQTLKNCKAIQVS